MLQPSELAQRKILLEAAAAALTSAARRPGKERSVEQALVHRARTLQALTEQPHGQGPEVQVEYLARSQAAAQGIADTWSALQGKPGEDSVERAAALADHLDDLSATLVRGASSVHSPPPAAADASAAELAVALLRHSADLAFDLALLALRVREAAGLAPPQLGIAVALPAAGRACACAAVAPARPAAGSAAVGPRPTVLVHCSAPAAPGFDAAAMKLALGKLPAAVGAWGRLLELQAQFLLRILAYFDEYWYYFCDDDCTFPGRPLPTLVAVGAVVSGGAGMGAFQPTLDVRWDFCCRNWCLLLWWETFVRSVTVTVNAGAPVAGRAAALLAARRRAPRVIAALAAPANPC